jgi:hypothetical protein
MLRCQRSICVVELSQVEPSPLHHPISDSPRALSQIIKDMFLAIFASDFPLQEHAANFSSQFLSRLQGRSAHTALQRTLTKALSVKDSKKQCSMNRFKARHWAIFSS